MFNQNCEKGVSLIITFFIMIIILTVVLSISIILYSEIKVIRNIGNSMISLYAADSGIEKVLYYDRQVLPEGASRGLCSMLDSNYCIVDPDPSNISVDHSIYCNAIPGSPISPAPVGDDCNYATCTNCTISFSTVLGNKNYSVQAITNSSYYLDIQSIGTFGGAGRKIEITAPLEQP